MLAHCELAAESLVVAWATCPQLVPPPYFTPRGRSLPKPRSDSRLFTLPEDARPYGNVTIDVNVATKPVGCSVMAGQPEHVPVCADVHDDGSA